MWFCRRHKSKLLYSCITQKATESFIIFLKTRRGGSLPSAFSSFGYPWFQGTKSSVCHFFPLLLLCGSRRWIKWKQVHMRKRMVLPSRTLANFPFLSLLPFKVHSVWKSLKRSHLFCLRIQHLPHFVVNFSIYAFVNFHQIKSITEQKWFITSSLL